jgi:hypothetical protein
MSVKASALRCTAALSFFLLLLISCLTAPVIDHSGSSLAFAKSQGAFEHTLIMQLDAPVADAVQAVQAVVNDQIIHGTQQYAKEKILFGAHSAPSSKALDDPQTGGRVFYKVAEKVLAPQNFRESESIGTITVRYIVQGVSATASTVQIDAVFVEDDRRRTHRSEGVVESAEYAEIQKKLEDLQAERNKPPEPPVQPAALEPAPGESLDSFAGLEKRLRDLRHQAELRTKDAVNLKSAPYRSAAAIQSLPSGTELLVMVVTPYWYGVETQDGHRGWLHRSEVEALP